MKYKYFGVALILLATSISSICEAKICEPIPPLQAGQQYCEQALVCPAEKCPFKDTNDQLAKEQIYQTACLQEGCIGYTPGPIASCKTYIIIPASLPCPAVFAAPH